MANLIRAGLNRHQAYLIF